MAAMEDGWGEGVEPGHHEISRWVVGLIDDIRDFAVLEVSQHRIGLPRPWGTSSTRKTASARSSFRLLNRYLLSFPTYRVLKLVGIILFTALGNETYVKMGSFIA